MNKWAKFTLLYAFGTLLIGVAISEYLKSLLYQENIENSSVMHVKQELSHLKNVALAWASVCFVLGALLILWSLYFPLLFMHAWCLRNYEAYEHRLEEIESGLQSNAVELNVVNEEQEPLRQENEEESSL